VPLGSGKDTINAIIEESMGSFLIHHHGSDQFSKTGYSFWEAPLSFITGHGKHKKYWGSSTTENANTSSPLNLVPLFDM